MKKDNYYFKITRKEKIRSKEKAKKGNELSKYN
jgi:hypothetical protein